MYRQNKTGSDEPPPQKKVVQKRSRFNDKHNKSSSFNQLAIGTSNRKPIINKHSEMLFNSTGESSKDIYQEKETLSNSESNCKNKSTQSEYSESEDSVCYISSEAESDHENESTQSDSNNDLYDEIEALVEAELNSEFSNDEYNNYYQLFEGQLDNEHESTRSEHSKSEDSVCYISSETESDNENESTQIDPNIFINDEIEVLTEAELNSENETTQRQPTEDEDHDAHIIMGGSTNNECRIYYQSAEAESGNEHESTKSSPNNDIHVEVEALAVAESDNKNESIQRQLTEDEDHDVHILTEKKSGSENESTQKDPRVDMDNDNKTLSDRKLMKMNELTEYIMKKYNRTSTDDDEDLYVVESLFGQLALVNHETEDCHRSFYKIMHTNIFEQTQNNNQSVNTGESFMMQDGFNYVNDSKLNNFKTNEIVECRYMNENNGERYEPVQNCNQSDKDTSILNANHNGQKRGHTSNSIPFNSTKKSRLDN